MNLLTANFLQYRVKHKKIIDDICVDIPKHEFIGLIGPNGAGKSTLLRILAGLTNAHSGEVALAIDGALKSISTYSLNARAKCMAYLAQHETPAWPLAVKHLVALGRSPWQNHFSKSSSHDNETINTAMQVTEVEHLGEQLITELSGGELQRVMLARVFAGTPQIIVADEPIASLDIYHQLHIMELLQEHAKKGGAVIAALHDLSLAARFCSRLILINQGKIIAQGTPAQVLTAENIEHVYGVNTSVECNQQGVVIMPISRITS